MSADVLGQLSADEFPHVVEVITQIMQTGREEDFEFGLDLILDGLERQPCRRLTRDQQKREGWPEGQPSHISEQ